ncbi:hypothetical protein PE067_06490 [Paracoccus sp. DMF-8]|uniref:hypothetical protein n=1 Tax=Paracoccus sp. DMF-8 TaxID=3019445 RepID=UPI0023E807A5|nr:hypothetical protein [Paracoccus sp. DMF-8]MDF3605824.1 hypothetical protein [Paracoccus sp. DMF-8]
MAERIHSVVQLSEFSVSVAGAALMTTSSRMTMPSVVLSCATAAPQSSDRTPAPGRRGHMRAGQVVVSGSV